MKTTEFSTEVLKLRFEVEYREEVPLKIKQEARKWFNSRYDFPKQFEYTVEDVTVTKYVALQQQFLNNHHSISSVPPPSPLRWTVEVTISRPLSIVNKEEEHEVVKESRLVLE